MLKCRIILVSLDGAIQEVIIAVQHKFASFREGHFNNIINKLEKEGGLILSFGGLLMLHMLTLM